MARGRLVGSKRLRAIAWRRSCWRLGALGGRKPIDGTTMIGVPLPRPMSQAGAQPWARIKSVLAGALERTAAERAAFLDTACGDDPTLRKEVESLLAASEDAEASEFIEKPPSCATPPASRATSSALQGPRGDRPRRHGRRLPGGARRRRVPEAGRAQGRGPARSRPACGASAPSGRSWPASTIPTSRGSSTAAPPRTACPTWSWSYVEGQPITEYCAGARAGDCASGWRCSATVCGAVQYAHQNLVVHRDLKPGEHPGHRRRARPSCSTSASPSCSPPRAAADRRPPLTRARADDARVREPRAGRGRAGHDGQRRLLAGRRCSTSC